MFYGNNAFASEGHDDDVDDDHEAIDHCLTPTTEVTITGGEGGQFVYDKKEYKVPKDTCVELLFVNLSIIEHDVSIDEVHDHLEEVHIHLANNTDGHDGDGVKSMHIQTPNEDTEFEIYCSVTGHKAGGMVATLIVGEGNPDDSFLPGFEFLGLFLAMSSLVIIYKRKNN
ncbi:MAG: Heimdall-CTERM domain-containing surface protein [Candidatus Hodarchaeales archaeon]